MVIECDFMKKLFLLLLILVLLAFPAAGGFAVDAPKIAGVNADFWRDPASFSPTVADMANIKAETGGELRIPFKPAAFVDGAGKPLDPAVVPVITATQLSLAGIKVSVRAETGAAALDGVSIQEGTSQHPDAYISVKFAETFPYTREIGFDYFISVSAGQSAPVEIKLSGAVANPVFDVYPDDEYADLSTGNVAEAKGYVKNIRVDIGNGISILSNFFEGSRYYGVSTVDFGGGDHPLVPTYPEVEIIYSLRTVGLKSQGRDCVSFDLPLRYYVYNAEGEYLGASNKPVAYSVRYFLTGSKLERIDLFDLDF
ncbi:hypothetical protein FACS1894191_7400 [Clostridia bacterium]|nr:hypothetical protein FACS1894191_7400 [Clostridia bacterium]